MPPPSDTLEASEYHAVGDGDGTGLSDAQEQILALLTVVSSTVSILGSFQIIYMVLSSKKRSPYRRILFGMSLCDVVFSLDLALQSFLLPSGSWAWAIGNNTTCTIAGFGLQLGFSALWYNAMLSLYFLLTVKVGVQEGRIATVYEPLIHTSAVGFGVITAIIALAMNAYHKMPMGLRCWITKDYLILGWIVGGFPTFFGFCMILLNNLLIYCHVRHTIQRTRRYRMGGPDSDPSTITSSRPHQQPLHESRSRSNISNNRKKNHDVRQRRTRAVATQAFCYVAAYVCVNTLQILQTLLGGFSTAFNNPVKMYPLMVLTATLYPLQGLFNMLVYARPSYLRARNEFPNETKLWAYRRALYGEHIAPQRQYNTPEASDFPVPHSSSPGRNHNHQFRHPVSPQSSKFASLWFYFQSSSGSGGRDRSHRPTNPGGMVSESAFSRPLGDSKISSESAVASTSPGPRFQHPKEIDRCSSESPTEPTPVDPEQPLPNEPQLSDPEIVQEQTTAATSTNSYNTSVPMVRHVMDADEEQQQQEDETV